ncbi:MAG: DNA adenine methylase [Bacillota bacterium]
MSKIIEKLEWGKYVSPMSDRGIPPFNWYSFKHRFSSSLAGNIFSMFNLSKGDTILDPFLGGATTLIKAKMEGYNAVGLDILPFSVFLANALTKMYDARHLRNMLNKLSCNIDITVAIPDVDILRKAFTTSTIKYIYSLRNSIDSLNSGDNYFFLLALLSLLDKTSKAKKAGGFLRITDQRKCSYRTVNKIFDSTCNKFIDDIENFKFTNTRATAVLGDARNYPNVIKKIQYDAILTSPPYPNRHDYTRIYELELLVGFINDNQSLKKLRYETLRSHVEAKKIYEVKDYIRPALLEDKLNKISMQELNNSKIIPTLSGYFEDMYLCLKEMHSVLKPGRYIGLIISNVRFAGIMIPVDELLGEIGEQVGLRLEAIYVLRYRGNSSQQMARHSKELSRESLVIWSK